MIFISSCNTLSFIVEKDQEEFNAAIGHVVHLLSLLTQYLGVKLPYVIVNRGVYSYAKEMSPNRQIR